MFALNLLTSLLYEKGVITKKEHDLIVNLYTLSAMAEGKVSSLTTPDEKSYIELAMACIQVGNFKEMERLSPPKSLARFHKRLLDSIPYLKVWNNTSVIN